MRITIKCFAGCKDAVGVPSLKLELPEGATVGGAMDRLIDTYPGLERYRRSLMLAVNREYASRETLLKDGDELACIPPVSGGVRDVRAALCPARIDKKARYHV